MPEQSSTAERSSTSGGSENHLRAVSVNTLHDAVSEKKPIIGTSEALARAFQHARVVAPTDATVLIRGETGTGKELFAHAIHENSKRSHGPFLKINCAAMSPGLVESELFGHEKGSFTGAIRAHKGKFESADSGTLFLDEVGDLPLETQVKLLRVLQEGAFERVGGSHQVRVNVRIVAATNRNLDKAVETGEFRADLLFRLNVFPITVPPLRERTSDIPELTEYFLNKLQKRLGKRLIRFSNSSIEQMTRYGWPGNVRELENVIERAAILAQNTVIELDTTSLPTRSRQPELVKAECLKSLREVEREHIITALMQTNWLISGSCGAAALLEINPNTLRSRMKKLGIRRSTETSP